MSHPLDGCWTKVNRANVHLKSLNERIQSLVYDGSTYSFEGKRDSKTGEVIVYCEALVDPPVEEWGAIIGDVVHNLRSALDHLVWQLTIANGHTPPLVILSGSPWKDIRFPIYEFDPRERYRRSSRRIPWRYKWPGWSGKKIAGSLWGVRPALRTDLQRLQPFNRRKDAAKEPLAVLDKLWNIDKHRHLPLAHFLVWLEDVSSIPPWSFAPEIELRIVEKQAPRPLKGRTEIGRVEQVGLFSSQFLKMYVHPDVFYDVAFEQGPPAYGDGVLETLKRLSDTVSAILVKFDSEFT